MAGPLDEVGDYGFEEEQPPPEPFVQPEAEPPAPVALEPRPVRALQRQVEQQNRLKASDLKERGVPTYRDTYGSVAAVTDEAGAPLLHYDKRNNIGYDSTGNPRTISYEPVTHEPPYAGPQDLSPPPGSSPDKFERAFELEQQQARGPTTTVEPVLRDPFEGLPLRTDLKTGDQYKIAKGLPWQWQGVDPEVRSQRMQEVKDKAIAREAALLGKKLSIDHADLVAGTAEHKQMMKELTASVPALQDPRLEGADRPTILKAIDDHFNTEYAQPQANETDGWFSKDLSTSAKQLREHIDRRKADAIETANGLYDLKDNLRDINDRVTAGRDQQRAEIDTLLAHGRGQPGPLDQPPSPESPTGQIGPDPQAALAEAKAGRKSYTIDDKDNIQFDPKKLSASAEQAAQDGLIDPKRWEELKPQLAELQKVTDEREKLIAAAGSNPKLKALLSGAVKGSAFAAGFPLGAGVGAEVGALGGPFDPLTIPAGAIIGGLITGTIASKGAEGIIKKVGDYNDAIHSLSASSELHPNYDLAGNLISFGAGAFTKGASKAVGAGVEALTAKAGAAVPEAIAPTVQKYGTAIARSYYGSGGGLLNTVKNLKEDASIRKAQLGDQAGANAQIAKAIAYRVGGAAAANVAIDTIINEGLHAVGAQPEGETWQNAGAAALLGAFTSGHGLEFQGYNKSQVVDILLRGKVRVDSGVGLSERLPPGLLERKLPNLDSQEAAAFHRPLSAKEQEVYENFGHALSDLQRKGQFQFDINTAELSARQALQGGQPHGVTAVDIRPGEAPPAPPPAPEAPKIGAPPTGVPPSEEAPPTTQVVTPPPASEPTRVESPGAQSIDTDAGRGGTTPGPLTPAGNVPPIGGTVTGGGAAPAPAPGGPPQVPAPAPEPGPEAAQPPTVPPAVTPPVEAPPAEPAPQLEFPPIEQGPVVTPPEARETPPTAAPAPTEEIGKVHPPTEEPPDFITEDHPLAGQLETISGPDTGFNRHEAVRLIDQGHAVYGTLPDGHEAIRIKNTADIEKYDPSSLAVLRQPAPEPPAAPEAPPVEHKVEHGEHEKPGYTAVPGVDTVAETQPPAEQAAHAPETVAKLKEYGYTDKGIGLMTPERAQDLVHKGVGVFQKAVAKLGVPLDVQEAMYQLTPAEAQAKYGASMTDLIHAATTGPESQRRLPEGFKIPDEEAPAPVEEAPSLTPQELYQKQTDTFDAYKALAHLRSDDPKRVAAWDAYQAAKAAFQQSTAHVVPPEKPKGKPKTPQIPPLPGMGPIGATPPQKVTYKIVGATDGYEIHDSTGKNHGYFSSKDRAKERLAELEKEEQPPISGPVEETPVVEEPPKAGGKGGKSGTLTPAPSKTEENLRKRHADLPRGVRTGNVPLVHLSREDYLKLGDGAGIGTSRDEHGNITFPFNAEILANSREVAIQNFEAAGNTPDQAERLADDLENSTLAEEHTHAREYTVGGARIDQIRERVWQEMKPEAKILMPKVYDMALPPEKRNRVLAAEYIRMKYLLAHGIQPAEAFINTAEYEKLLPLLQQEETPFIERHLRNMDDLTKQDTELPFGSNDLNELYQFHAKKDLSDVQAQAAVIADVVEPFDDVEEAVDAAESAPAGYIHTTGSGHKINRDAFVEAVERANEEAETATIQPVVNKPEVLSDVPRKPMNVPPTIGGPGVISDTDMSQAEVVPMYAGTGELAHGFFKMLDGTEIPITYTLMDGRLVVENPKNEQPGPLHPDTQEFLQKNGGKNYDDRKPFVRDPDMQAGPPIVEPREGRFQLWGGHRRTMLYLINREAYEAALPKNLGLFGINPAFVEQMTAKDGWPYLAAVIDIPLTDEQREALGRQLNTAPVQAKNPIFEAVSAGRNLTQETIDTAGKLFEDFPASTPLAALQLAESKELARLMLKDGAIRATDEKKFLHPNGEFTKEGAEFARMALIGNVIDSPEILDKLQNTPALTKLLNAIGPLYVMKRRGQDMEKFTRMLYKQYEMEKNGWSVQDYYDEADADFLTQRYADIEAIHKWFNSFKSPQARKEFIKAINDFLPLEKGQEPLLGEKNVDLGEGLITAKNLETLMAMKSGKDGGMTAHEKVLKALKEKEAKGVKLTPAEHDLVLKLEKKLGQKLLIDPNKTPRKVQEPDVFPEETKPVEPKRAVLGGQTDLDILAPGIEKSGQQTLFAMKPQLLAIPQPPQKPVGHVKGEPFDAVFNRHQEYEKALAEWVKSIPLSAPIVLTNPERPNNAAVITPVVPRKALEIGKIYTEAGPSRPFHAKATEPGQWRVSTFDRPMVPQLGDNFVMKMQPGDPRPTGHNEYGSREEAVSSALYTYPKFSPEVLFARKPKEPTPFLPGISGEAPLIRWKEGPSGDIWDGVTKEGVAYMITEVTPGTFQIHYFNPDGGGADDIGTQPDLSTAKKSAETHFAMWKADNRNRPARSESYKLIGPKAQSAQGELRLDQPEQAKKRIPQNKPVSLLTSRAGMTQRSPINFLPERFKKIAKPHQQHGANLALWAFDGGTGFLNNDGPGAGKTVQQLMVAQIMANTKALEDKFDERGKRVSNYSKEHGSSPRRRPLTEGMTHATMIVTENERIIQNAFAKDAEMLGIEAWRYMGDDPKPDRVYLATYNDLRSGRVRPGQFRTFIFDEAQGLRNAGYETAQALAGTQLSALAQHVMYATATPFDKPEQIIYLTPLIGDAAIKEVFETLGIKVKKGKPDPKTGKADVRFTYPDNITAKDIEDIKEAIFTELTRNGKMISRNVPLDNVKVDYVEVPISDSAFIIADEMYRRIYAAVAEKSAQNAGGVAGMTVRAFLENQKIEPTLKMIHESIAKGNQVVVFASRIKDGTAGSYQEGIEGTLDNLFAELETAYGKGTIGRVYGGDNKRSVRDIDRFQRNAIKVMLATPNSGGTGINLDDTFGDVPRDMIIITSPLSAIELIQDVGRINRLTTLSVGNVKILFVDHPVDTWNIDISADKMRTLSATVGGDLKNIKPLKQRTEEIKLNDDAVALMTVFQREPQFQKIMRQMTTGQPGYISEQEARDRLTSPEPLTKADAQRKADKFFKDIQDETDRQRNNARQMSEDDIMELVDDEQKFAALSPGHAHFQEALTMWVRSNTIFPTDAEMLRAFAAQAKGEMLERIDYSEVKMNPLGRGGGSFGGRGTIELQLSRSDKHNPYLSNNMGKVVLHEYGHVGYFVLLSVAERRAVARIYAKLGGRSGTQAYFVQGTPQARQSKSRYYSKNVYEFFAESFSQYVMEKRVPGEIMQRLHERVINVFNRNFEMMRRRKDITREPGLQNIYEKILDLKKNAKDIDYSYPDRSSLLLSTKPPKGLSRGETERWLAHKASIYNSLATNRPPVLVKGQGAPKIMGAPEKGTARLRPLPSGTEPIVPQTSALALRKPLPKSMGAFEGPAGMHPVATETLLGGEKNHFYILPTSPVPIAPKGGWGLYMRTGSTGPLHGRSAALPTRGEVVDVLKKTLEAGAKLGARHVWHQAPETLHGLKPKAPQRDLSHFGGEGYFDKFIAPDLPAGKVRDIARRMMPMSMDDRYELESKVYPSLSESERRQLSGVMTRFRKLIVGTGGERNASKEPSAEGVGVRGEGGEVGAEAPLRQPGEIAREGETQKVQGGVTTGRGGGVQRVTDPNDPGHSGVIEPETLHALSPKQLTKLAGVNWAKDALSDIAGLFPTAKGGKHLAAANDVRRFLGERNRQAEIAKRLINKKTPTSPYGSWGMFIRMGAEREDLPYDSHPGTQFAHAMSTGKPVRGGGGVSIPVMITQKMEADLKARGHTQAEINAMKPQEAHDILYPPGLDDAAKLYKKLLDERILQAEAADAPLHKIKEHYFAGYWTVQSRRAFNQALDEILTDKEKEKFDANNTPEAKMAEIRARVKELIKENADKGSDQLSAFARTPFKGPEKFRHQSVFEDKLTAEKFGLEPTFPNPADAVMAKLHELDQSIMANKLFQKWKREGNLRINPPKARVPDGWRKIPDPFGEVWTKASGYGWTLVGERIVPAEYADILENYLSKSLYQSRYFGKPFSLWMAFANILNQVQLGIGSAFHAGFTSGENQISTNARVLQDIYGVMRGNRTMADLGRTLKEVPTTMFMTPKDGDAVFNAYMTNTPSQDPRINKIVRALELAGAGSAIEKGLRTEQSAAAYRDYYSGRKVRAAMRSPAALIELLAKPIMDMLVPRQKFGVFAHEAWRLIEANPGKTLEELGPQFSKLWTTIDARLGQVQYKRLFMDNVFKNITQMFIRAPGWTGGTILQLGGAVKDAGNFFKEWHETGSLPKDLPPRTAYAISLITTVAVMNAVLSYLFTGKKPEGQDYWAFRTGREDEHGNPERFVLPTYMKDLYAYGKHPGETILNKTHPALSLFMELLRNKDYYGVEVRDPDANVVKQAYQSGKHVIAAFQPFWWRGAVRAGQRGKGLPEKVLPLIGVMPAPRALTQTPAQAELDKYWKTHQPESGISPEQFEIQQSKRRLVSDLRQGKNPNITEAISKGVIKPRDISALYKRARLGSIASSVDRLPLVEAEKVYAKANAVERQQMAGILERKRAGSYRRGGRTMFQGF